LRFCAAKNKPNLLVLRIGFVIPVKTGIQFFGNYGFRIKCGMTSIEPNLKKQSQFAGGHIDVNSY